MNSNHALHQKFSEYPLGKRILHQKLHTATLLLKIAQNITREVQKRGSLFLLNHNFTKGLI